MFPQPGAAPAPGAVSPMEVGVRGPSRRGSAQAPDRSGVLVVQIIRLVPGSEDGSRPFPDVRPSYEIEAPCNARTF
jgi:hypothetical protein